MERLREVVQTLREGGTSMVLVEQDLRLACAVADEVVVMEKGTVALRRATSEVRRGGATARRLLSVA